MRHFNNLERGSMTHAQIRLLVVIGISRTADRRLLRECRVSAEYDADQLWRERGDVRMTDLRHDLAANLGCHRGPHADYRDKCGLLYIRIRE
jgi:hypothetical protein